MLALTVAQAARQARVTKQSIYYRLRKGHLTSDWAAGEYRIPLTPVNQAALHWIQAGNKGAPCGEEEVPVAVAAQIMKCSVSRVYQLVHAGTLAARTDGWNYYVPVQEAFQWAARRCENISIAR